jgi:3-oxoacyl-[acyl-carrier protein] reductase
VDLELTGKVALVTGAGRGIGAAVACGLAREGCDVALVDREDVDAVAEEVRARGRRVLVLRADVSRLAAAEESVARVLRDLGRLDILVCNAGITRDAVIWKMTEEECHRGLDQRPARKIRPMQLRRIEGRRHGAHPVPGP